MFKKLAWFTILIVILGSVAILVKPYLGTSEWEAKSGGEVIKLPEPRLRGEMSVEEAIARRRSIRTYKDEPLTIEELSQLLWAAQGITDERRKFRAAPSAGATYPFEVYVVVGKVMGLKPGVYLYNPFEHSLILVREGNFMQDLEEAALNQKWVGNAAINIVLVAYYERTTSVYGERGIRYVHMEAGHIGQNIYLQATSLGLGTVAVGAFHDDVVADILGTDGHPLYIFPVGRV
ncbi:SagB/ThcOx family dehydrogenase [Pyrococcus abyssi]|uniref:NADH oxidase (Noxc) n=1 Tax=Pyrococcus abyssi (strain GE5 / Orsay) TaxID=272844 RepID=Q9V234_PYRAB|nr:SagB/ThcOx family dehydrogenase [Pyrococcus abyssi]CAB49164.1 Nitroreductase [Pyrococcus abyssi GE5]CCE69616.1 TPA: NADH oxidase (noxc) [Pyrococcus abyssi GE5]